MGAITPIFTGFLSFVILFRNWAFPSAFGLLLHLTEDKLCLHTDSKQPRTSVPSPTGLLSRSR